MLVSELRKIGDWIKDVLNEAWEIEERGNEIIARYEDAYDTEKIEIEIEINEYGVVTYNVVMEYANKTDEIPICDSCHDTYCEDCWLFKQFGDKETGEIDHKKLDEYFNKEVEKHENQTHYELSGFNGKINVKPIIVERKCYLDIPHYHYYRGVSITAELHDFDELKALITLRDYFYKLIKTF